MKFQGTIQELSEIVAMRGCQGNWLVTPDNRHRFKQDNGAGLNWAPTTGNIWFDGPTASRRTLEDNLDLAVRAWVDREAKKRRPVLPSTPPKAQAEK